VNIKSETPLAPLINAAKLRTYPRGQIILYEGEAPTDVYIIKNGIVKVHDIDNQGNEKILHILKAPSLFPLAYFMQGTQETQSFHTSLTEVELYVLPQQQATTILKDNNELAQYLIEWFALETHELLVRLSSMEKSTTRDKLIAALKFLCVYHASKEVNNWKQIDFPVSHQLLADMIGVTRESTTMVMKELQETSLVRNPRLTVLQVNFKNLVKL